MESNIALLRPTQPLILINGWPAVGKQAIAQCLFQFLGHDRAVIIDDREFTDMLNLSPEDQMARYVSRAESSRVRGLSMGGHGKHDHSNGTDGNYSSKGSIPMSVCTDKNCVGNMGMPSQTSPSKTTSVVRECIAGRLITAHDEISRAAQARQEACFRKYVLDIAEVSDTKPRVVPRLKGSADNKNKSLLTNKQKVIIFTQAKDCCADNAAGAERARRYADVAKEARRPFIPIYAECLPEEHERRSKSSERVYNQHNGAEISGAEAARALQAVANGRLFTFPLDEVPGLFVDVTTRGSHASVMDIISFINAVMEKRDTAVKEAAVAAARLRPGKCVDAKVEDN